MFAKQVQRQVFALAGGAPCALAGRDGTTEWFERHVPEVRARFGEQFVRMWWLYLRSSAAACRAGTVELHHVLGSNGTTDGVPLTPANLYDDGDH